MTTDTDNTTIAVSRDTKSRLDDVADGTYDDKIQHLIDSYESSRIVLEVDDDERVSALIEEHA